ncbi:phage late control D family protein [Chitiniphilus eburneus]|uniref:phage late control D family protein n=1 Tax=Chitiniphilus eburneus TaxID=2571148 RepID=UPI0035D01552
MSGHPRPAWTLTADGSAITAALAPRLISLTLTDNRGLEADTLELVLDDADGRLDLPMRGTELRLALGWQGQGLIDKGSYTVTDVEHAGTPDTITVRATSANLRGALADLRERSWHQTSVGAIVRKIATEHGLTPAIEPTLDRASVGHLDQANESDINLLTRLAREHDAIATIKAGRLLFLAAGQGTSVSGAELPTLTIERRQGDQHRFSLADRDQASTVVASYQDSRSSKRGSVRYAGPAGERPSQTKSKAIAADTGNTLTLRHVYASKGNAQRGAKSAWERAQRGAASFSISLALGRPDLIPECPVRVQGFKPLIDGQPWIVKALTHTLGDGGLTTSVELEVLLETAA